MKNEILRLKGDDELEVITASYRAALAMVGGIVIVCFMCGAILNEFGIDVFQSMVIFFHLASLIGLWVALGMICIDAKTAPSLAAITTLRRALKEKTEKHLVFYLKLPDISEKERAAAITILNDQHKGWSLKEYDSSYVLDGVVRMGSYEKSKITFPLIWSYFALYTMVAFAVFHLLPSELIAQVSEYTHWWLTPAVIGATFTLFSVVGIAIKDQITVANNELKGRLREMSDEYLLAYSQSPEVSLQEKDLAVEVLGERSSNDD